MTSRFHSYVGVDISAKTFTATWTTNPAQAPRPITFDQSPEGYHAFQQQLAETGTSPPETLVVLEATGSY